MDRKNRTIWLVFLLTSAIIAGGVLWYTQKITRETEVMQSEMMKRGEEIVQAVRRLQEERKQQTPKTFEDLIAQAEEITLPEVDTSDWKTYKNEEMGFSVMIPKGFINNVKITKNNTGTSEKVCFFDKTDMQKYEMEGTVEVAPRYLCFSKLKLNRSIITMEELILAWKKSSNRFRIFDVSMSDILISAKLYFGYGSGIIFETVDYRWNIEDSHIFDSKTFLDDVGQLYYSGIIKTFRFIP